MLMTMTSEPLVVPFDLRSSPNSHLVISTSEARLASRSDAYSSSNVWCLTDDCRESRIVINLLEELLTYVVRRT